MINGDTKWVERVDLGILLKPTLRNREMMNVDDTLIQMHCLMVFHRFDSGFEMV
jgi:hypothetical protein